jgi:RND family efflux transporter MFP subunit
MSDKSDLLNKLKLDRSVNLPRRARRWPWLIGALAVLIAVGSAAFVSRAPKGIPVGFAVARAADAAAPAAALDASGYVVARRQATVAAKITARVTEIMIEEGQHVSGGQIMARLDDSNIHAALVQAQAQFSQSAANLTAAKVALTDETPIFQRSQDLNRKGWVSGADLDSERAKYDEAEQAVKVAEQGVAVAAASLKVAERNQEDTVVRAPYDGVITVKAAQPGEVVSPLSAGGGFTRTGIGTLVDMDSLEVEVDVSESFIDRTRPGQEAVVRLNAYPDWQIPASVIAIIPTADRSKATVKVRVGFKQKDPRILPEMGARVAFLAKSASTVSAVPSGVLIPEAAASGTGDHGSVFVIKGERVEQRTVMLGAKTGREQAVLQGLTAGETVAVGDLSRLTNGALIRRAEAN